MNKDTYGEEIIVVHWTGGGRNWGDAIAPFLIKSLIKENKKLKTISINTIERKMHYSVIGSINQLLINSSVVVWGSGFIKKDLKNHITIPQKVCAVRGPLSREIYEICGVKCPEIYGDPALLMSQFYNPKNIQKKYCYGIIPHYIDKGNPWLNKFKSNKDVKIINIQNTEEELKSHRFINDILECEIILSSSLHGLIAADSYGIPSYWIELSNKVIGNGFKFRDYFLSVNRSVLTPIVIQGDESIQNISHHFYDYDIDIENIQRRLLESCPFKSKI